jgi:hypothetical protein
MNGALSFGSAGLWHIGILLSGGIASALGDRTPRLCEEGASKLEDEPMLKSALIAAAAVATLTFGAMQANADTLSGDTLRSAITGKTVFLKISGFELPIQYSARGTMKGSMGTVAAALARGDGSSDYGKWWVDGDQLCQKWNSWMEGQTYCYTLSRNGNAVRWVRNDGRSGTARIGG